MKNNFFLTRFILICLLKIFLTGTLQSFSFLSHREVLNEFGSICPEIFMFFCLGAESVYAAAVTE